MRAHVACGRTREWSAPRTLRAIAVALAIVLGGTTTARARETDVVAIEVAAAPTFFNGYLRYRGQPYATYDQFLPGYGLGLAARVRIAIDDSNAVGVEGRFTVGWPFKHGEPEGLLDLRAYLLYERSLAPAGHVRLVAGGGLAQVSFLYSQTEIYIPGELHSPWESMTGPAWMGGVVYDFDPRSLVTGVLGLRAHFGVMQNGSEVYAPMMLTFDATVRF